ncbi:DNA phosphorothioation-dependent restriction protein DptF [Halioxenophilus aromaticivorans]|uniref:DNA phosphorothioation-dependent restriction protein DptF n=1 Tax=Halioxenophilus aromaticivorans TaxID=1306992 RepID=A0AAV3U984_9ALTE
MDFQDLLGTLARSSAQAVSTLKKSSHEVENLRSYLYVETEIERQFVKALDSTPSSDSILFLCGSSGDGKSEILRRHYEKYSKQYRFHLDATHSFKPDQDAVQALNQLFDEHQESERPLIVGINIGMMFNFQNAGAERHSQIRDAIGRFIQGERDFECYHFLSFEDYPKFSLEEGNVGSEFISELFAKVTAKSNENLLYSAYLDDEKNHHKLEYHNYRILQEESVQKIIVKELLHVRLKYDQFFSARAILDFIHNLIAGGSNLYDNLFSSASGGLGESFSNLDPCQRRSQRIDEFIVQRSLDIDDEVFEKFKAEYQSRYGAVEMSPNCWIRVFYLLRDVDFENNYHKQFSADFEITIFEDYIKIWQLHRPPLDKRKLRNFYNKTIIASLVKYANRLAPKIVGDGLYLAERNGVIISAKVDMGIDFGLLKETNSDQISNFFAAIKVGEEPVKTFPVSISFLELTERIMAGYRPNRHDKNTVVILEEVVEEITRIALKSETLYFHRESGNWSLLLEDDEFVAEAC